MKTARSVILVYLAFLIPSALAKSDLNLWNVDLVTIDEAKHHHHEHWTARRTMGKQKQDYVIYSADERTPRRIVLPETESYYFLNKVGELSMKHKDQKMKCDPSATFQSDFGFHKLCGDEMKSNKLASTLLADLARFTSSN